MKKRILALFICAAVALSAGACGKSDVENTEGALGAAEQPTITELASYDDLSAILSGDYEITEEYVNVYFTDVLFNAGVGYIKVTDRDTVQAGDIVKTDYTGYLNGVAFSGGTATEQWIDVSNNCGVDPSTGSSTSGYIPGFTDGLIGAKVGEKASGDVTFPENYQNTDLAGQLTTFEFTVEGIYMEVTPENITDEFVQENLSQKYDVSTVDEFMAFVREELAYNFTIDYLIENSTFNIPESYLDIRLSSYEAYFEELYCQGLSIEEYLSYYGTTIESARAQWTVSLQSQVKAELVFAAIAQENDLKLDEKAHNEYIETVIAVNTTVFPDAASIYKYAGAGDGAVGELYMKNQSSVREYIVAEYNALGDK